jgi:hypothetical protein
MTEPEGAPADEGAAGSIASNLAGLTAKSYADNVPEKDRGLDKPIAKVKLRLKDGTEHTFTFGKAEGDDVVMSVSGKPDPYKVYKYVYDNVNKDLKKKDDDKKDPADPHSGLPGFNPGGTPGTLDPAMLEMIKIPDSRLLILRDQPERADEAIRKFMEQISQPTRTLTAGGL